MQKEVLMYTASDAWADVGGYLGLLLGISFLNIYDKAAAQLAKFCAKK